MVPPPSSFSSFCLLLLTVCTLHQPSGPFYNSSQIIFIPQFRPLVAPLGSRHSTAPPESPSETFSSLPLARHVPTLASGMLLDHSHQFLPWKAHLRPSDPFPSPATSPTLASGMLLAHSRQVCLRAFALAVPLAWNGFPGDRMPRSLTELSSLLSCPSIKRPCLE